MSASVAFCTFPPHALCILMGIFWVLWVPPTFQKLAGCWFSEVKIASRCEWLSVSVCDLPNMFIYLFIFLITVLWCPLLANLLTAIARFTKEAIYTFHFVCIHWCLVMNILVDLFFPGYLFVLRHNSCFLHSSSLPFPSSRISQSFRACRYWPAHPAQTGSTHLFQ